jgi:putative toxin-antitoxin system antitoxin component (TIGR02293 family)
MSVTKFHNQWRGGVVRRVQHARRGRSIGLRRSDVAGLVRQVNAGFHFSRLVRFQKVTALPWDKIAQFVQIPRRTLARRESEGRLRPDESDRVLRASTVFDMVVDLFEGDSEAARQWLQTPQPGLGGEIPIDLATTGIGAREVENLICRLEDGVFA